MDCSTVTKDHKRMHKLLLYIYTYIYIYVHSMYIATYLRTNRIHSLSPKFWHWSMFHLMLRLGNVLGWKKMAVFKDHDYLCTYARFSKVHIFWAGHKILRNLHLTFDYSTYSQKLGEDFAKFCGLLMIYEL